MCEKNIHDTVSLMTDLGFMIHEKKSILVPTRKITFLGKNIDWERRIVTLPHEKLLVIVQGCDVLQGKKIAKIRDVASFISLIISILTHTSKMFQECNFN